MAINQVSLFFYPPRWIQRLAADPRALTDEGKPVQIVDAVRIDDAEGPPVLADQLGTWLAEQGFNPAEWGRGRIFERGNVQSIFGTEAEIEISVGDQSGEVTHLYCRFTLPRRTPPPLSQWAALVASLCGRFELRLEGKGVAPCAEAAFLAAVRNSRNYREFAAAFGWSLCDGPLRITIQDGIVLIDDFSPEIRSYYVDIERELPIVRDAVRRLVEEGQTRFIFDLRTADLFSAYPIAKWGAMYGAFFPLRLRQPEFAAALAKNIKLVGSWQLEEIRLRRLDRIFECFATTEEAKAALRQQNLP